MSWFNSVLGGLNSVAGWMESNPVAAQMIGGAAVGGLQYFANEKLIDEQDDRDERMLNRRNENSMASSGVGSSGYGNHAAALTGDKGLLTNGLLAQKK